MKETTAHRVNEAVCLNEDQELRKRSLQKQ